MLYLIYIDLFIFIFSIFLPLDACLAFFVQPKQEFKGVGNNSLLYLT